ncbi:hypothetical protein AMECASPLE_009734 [Ameca splendens]|uniref:Uncharacterized protein n=1 Tax=Ameca splendens TaxID=208324 RepID=A0ABV0XP98_9TELE
MAAQLADSRREPERGGTKQHNVSLLASRHDSSTWIQKPPEAALIEADVPTAWKRRPGTHAHLDSESSIPRTTSPQHGSHKRVLLFNNARAGLIKRLGTLLKFSLDFVITLLQITGYQETRLY